MAFAASSDHPGPPSLAPSDYVRDTGNQDGAVLLDIRQGICLSLTPAATRIWELLKLGWPAGQIVDALCLHFPAVPKPQIHEDVVEFLDDLAQKGMLVTQHASIPAESMRHEWLLALAPRRTGSPRGPSTARKREPGFLVWKALVGLAAFDLLGFGASLARLLALVRAWGAASPVAPAGLAERVCRAIDEACVWYPKRVLCLQRSAVTTCLLRSCGVSAQMVIGAQKCPFKAHAWTEVDGHAVHERKDVQSVYGVWERC